MIELVPKIRERKLMRHNGSGPLPNLLRAHIYADCEFSFFCFLLPFSFVCLAIESRNELAHVCNLYTRAPL